MHTSSGWKRIEFKSRRIGRTNKVSMRQLYSNPQTHTLIPISIGRLSTINPVTYITQHQSTRLVLTSCNKLWRFRRNWQISLNCRMNPSSWPGGIGTLSVKSVSSYERKSSKWGRNGVGFLFELSRGRLIELSIRRASRFDPGTCDELHRILSSGSRRNRYASRGIVKATRVTIGALYIST